MSKEQFTNYLQSKGHSSKSIASRVSIMADYFTWLERENMEVEEVGYNDLLLYMKYKRSRGVNQRSIQNYIGAIKHVYDCLLETGKVDANPVLNIVVKGVKRKMLYPILETHKLQGLYDQYDTKSAEDKQRKVMLGVLLYQGVRAEELGKLTVKDINLREGTVQIPGGRKSNNRQMKLEVVQVMDMYDYVLKVRDVLLKNTAPTEALFIGQSKSGPRLRGSTAGLLRKLKQLNAKVISLRQIRASVITKWLKIHNLREVQYLAGHRYISSTESYLQNDVEGLKEEIQQYHPLG